MLCDVSNRDGSFAPFELSELGEGYLFYLMRMSLVYWRLSVSKMNSSAGTLAVTYIATDRLNL